MGFYKHVGIEAFDPAIVVVDRCRVAACPLGNLLAGGTIEPLLGKNFASSFQNLGFRCGAVFAAAGQFSRCFSGHMRTLYEI